MLRIVKWIICYWLRSNGLHIRLCIIITRAGVYLCACVLMCVFGIWSSSQCKYTQVHELELFNFVSVKPKCTNSIGWFLCWKYANHSELWLFVVCRKCVPKRFSKCCTSCCVGMCGCVKCRKVCWENRKFILENKILSTVVTHLVVVAAPSTPDLGCRGPLLFVVLCDIKMWQMPVISLEGQYMRFGKRSANWGFATHCRVI